MFKDRFLEVEYLIIEMKKKTDRKKKGKLEEKKIENQQIKSERRNHNERSRAVLQRHGGGIGKQGGGNDQNEIAELLFVEVPGKRKGGS